MRDTCHRHASVKRLNFPPADYKVFLDEAAGKRGDAGEGGVAAPGMQELPRTSQAVARVRQGSDWGARQSRLHCMWQAWQRIGLADSPLACAAGCA